MEVVTWPITKLSPNSRNPRTITSDQLERLKASLVSFPEMMQLRPVVVSPDGTILGGNMRYRAAKELGWKEVPVIVASNISDAKRAEFIIRDNVGLGEWDFDMLANDWDIEQLAEWGVEMNIPNFEDDAGGTSLGKQPMVTCPECGHVFPRD